MKNSETMQESLPYDKTKRLFGILAIVLSPFLIGFIFGMLAVYLIDKDNRMYQSFPIGYSQIAIQNHQTSKRWATTGFIVSLILSIIIIYFYYNYGTINPARLKELLN
ncbi:MAG: hypothetical protein ACKOXF_01075 [Chitinophagaceae bacterium]